MANINIAHLSKAAILAGLYNEAQVLGMGTLHAKEGDMPIDDAHDLIKSGRTYFDYVYGRVIKVNLAKDSFDPCMYNRDNGAGKAERIVGEIRKKYEDGMVAQQKSNVAYPDEK
jgi:hypothetical protein